MPFVSSMMYSQRSGPTNVVARWLGPLLLAGVAACGGGSPEGPAGAGAGRGGGMGVPVEVIELASQPVEQAGEFVGTLRSRRSTTIQPQAEGFITAIPVKSGDRVARGTVLFEIDAATQQAAVAGLQSARAAREADATYARQQADRARSLLGVGATSQQEYEQATTLQKTAEAQLKAVEDQIRQQEAELAYYRIASPTAGVLGDIPVRVGDRVTRATTLTTVDDVNTGLEAYINVPVQQAPLLKNGLVVRLLDDKNGVIATERMNFVSPSVDDATQTVLVKAPVDTRGGQFRNDQFVRAQIVFGTTEGLRIPVTSVTRINGQYFVFVAESERGGTVAHQRPVMVGATVGNEYLVLSGLKAGDRLISGGIQKIGEGAPVTPMPPGGGAPARGGAPAGRGQ